MYQILEDNELKVIEKLNSKLVDLSEHDLRLQSTMIAFGENMRQINDNLKEMAHVSTRLAERIKVLEADLTERSIKKQLMLILMAVYPFLIGALLLITNMDHVKVKELIRTIHSLTVSTD